MSESVSSAVLSEMREYYRARAGEYDEWFYRRGRYDRGAEANARWFDEIEEVARALEACRLEGDVLELAPGTGIWTERLVRTAQTLTAVDAAPEMIAINRARVASERVTYVQADLFAWKPERTYDAAFFGFWLSHVPRERLDAFFAMLADALRPGAKLFFVDSRREPSSTAADHILPEEEQQTMTRRLNDGRTFEIVKNFYEPEELAQRLQRAGFAPDVRTTATYFLYGSALRSER